MDLPDLVEQRLGDERVRATVGLDGDNLAAFTPTRTLVYRAESLLRDATVEEYEGDIERLSVSVGRRKTTFALAYVDGTEQFTVPKGTTDAVLKQVLRGGLDAADVLADDERVREVYRFSDLTVVVTDARLIKHIGTDIWDSDYEEFPFAAVTGLEFEEGDVATQVVLWVEGRAERIKAPNEEAPVLRQTLIGALLEFHDADSLDQLNERLAPAEDTPAPSSLALDDDIAPLIETSEADEPATVDDESTVAGFDLDPDEEWQSRERDVDETATPDLRPNRTRTDSDGSTAGSDDATGDSDDMLDDGDTVGGTDVRDHRAEALDAGDATDDSEEPLDDGGAAGDSDDALDDGDATDDSEEPLDDGDATGDSGDVPDDAPAGREDGESAALGEVSAAVAETDIERLERQVADLARAVERQNEILERQGRQIAELAEYLDALDRE